MVQTKVNKTLDLCGHTVEVHACPWTLYREIGRADTVEKQLDVMERVVRECAEVKDGTDLFELATKEDVDAIFKSSVSPSADTDPTRP